jgi:Asp-tRNA(Asn)/Glu-tRNA(Gln) amidotransferase A subunit family amidase
VAGSLHGIPLAIKDNYYTAGVVTTANSHIFADFVPEHDAEAWRRLRDRGALLAGKTQMGPLATSRATTPDGRATTRNAWAPGDSTVSPGGSSSGSATAVAAGLALGATGTQTGGSITNPADAQGLTGLKPTMGRVSMRGIIPLTYTRDHPGPIARDALDAAVLLQAMAGPDDGDPRTLGLPRPGDYVTAATPYRRGGETVLRRRLRIGVPPGYLDAPSVPDPPAADADPDEHRRARRLREWRLRQGAEIAGRRAFLETMRTLGAEIVEVPLPEDWDTLTSRAFNDVRLPERAEPFIDHLRTDVRQFGVVLSSWINGLLLPGTEYLKGQRAKLVLLRRLLDETLARCDVLAQTSPIPFDMVGLPLVTFPVGQQERGGRTLPYGVLMGAAPFEEDRLLEVAAAWQDVSDWHRRRPPLWDEAGGSRGADDLGSGSAGRRRGRELHLDVLDVEAQSE